MADKAGDMMDIVRDILLTAKFDDFDRFKQVGMGGRGRVGGCWGVGGGVGGGLVVG